MKNYIEIKDGIIVGCGQIDIDVLPSHYTEVTIDMYKKITNLPADFNVDESGIIIDIIPEEKPPEPPKPPTEIELLQQENATLGQMVTEAELENMAQGQIITDLELRVLGLEAKVNV